MEYDIDLSENRILLFNKFSTANSVKIIDYNQIFNTENFQAFIIDKAEYVLFIFIDPDTNVKSYFEMNRNGKFLLTNESELLSPEYKTLQGYLKRMSMEELKAPVTNKK